MGHRCVQWEEWQIYLGRRAQTRAASAVIWQMKREAFVTPNERGAATAALLRQQLAAEIINLRRQEFRHFCFCGSVKSIKL